MGRGGLCAAAALGAACAPAAPPRPELYTVERALSATDGDAGGIPFELMAVKAGAEIPTRALFESPAPTAPEGGPTVPVHIAFSEGEPGAYTITEVWTSFDEVWVQPLYIAVSETDGIEAPGNRVFGIDTASRFYSPFWVVRFYTVPAGTAPGTFRSAREVLDHVARTKAEVRAGPGAICSIVPDGTRVDDRRPLFGDAVEVATARVWVEGRLASVVSFGLDRFRWDERQVVVEDPIYAFVADDGKPLGLPNVGGGSAPAPGGRPQAALWRVHLVRAPAGAKPFVPMSDSALRVKLFDRFGELGPVDAAIEGRDPAELKRYTLRLATNPDCWAPDHPDAAGFPESCRFLDSEAAVRAEVPASAITRTGTTATCPFIYWKNRPVP